MNNTNNRIESLQALRAIAFIGIFLSHAGAPFKWPALGVSIFYVLSGFLMNYKHSEILDYSPKGMFKFSIDRIKKLYPLHIITMICALVLAIVTLTQRGLTIKAIIFLIGKTVLNIFLLQTWVPNSGVNTSLNGVAWYLSVTMFLYFMFPQIQRFIKKKKQSTLWIICIIILFLELLSCIPMIMLFGADSPVYIWFMYCFPVFRLGDFFVGCTLARWYSVLRMKQNSFAVQSLIEIIATILVVLVLVWRKSEHSNIFLLSLNNWTTLFIPFAAIFVLLFTIKGGLVTRFLSNKALIFIGNISSYTFLIHYVVTQYTKSALSFLKLELPTHILMIIILFEFIVTIALSLFYKRYESRLLSVLTTIKIKKKNE